MNIAGVDDDKEPKELGLKAETTHLHLLFSLFSFTSPAFFLCTLFFLTHASHQESENNTVELFIRNVQQKMQKKFSPSV